MRGDTTVTAEMGVIRAPRLAIELRSPVADKLKGYADRNLKTRPLIVAIPGLYTGKTLALCGAGPSLESTWQQIQGYDHVFACNSALPYLVGKGVAVTAGVGIDQTPRLAEEWANPPKLPYYVASTVDPALVAHLQAHGSNPVFFHSAVGFEGEWEYYCNEWPPMFMVGQGYTVVSRFLGLAEWMGFESVDIYGADCAFGDGDVTHANGTVATSAYHNPLIMAGKIDGREWRTRPDMLMEAVYTARKVRDSGGRFRLVGDTLPAQLLDKDDEFLDLVCRSLAPGERSVGIS